MINNNGGLDYLSTNKDCKNKIQSRFEKKNKILPDFFLDFR